MAAPRRDEPKRDKLACGTGAVMTMDAAEMAGKLVPIRKKSCLPWNMSTAIGKLLMSI
jgi:hypothetical protein